MGAPRESPAHLRNESTARWARLLFFFETWVPGNSNYLLKQMLPT